MHVLTNDTLALWYDVIRHAEDKCSLFLGEDLEAYLVSLLIRYTNQPEVAKRVLATDYFEALQKKKQQRYISLQKVGDQCLIFAGLFPQAAIRKRVKIKYFVDLGRTSYASISDQANDLFYVLAIQFVALMDVLQSIPDKTTLLPMDAYEQWVSLGSRHAFRLLNNSCIKVTGHD